MQGPEVFYQNVKAMAALTTGAGKRGIPGVSLMPGRVLTHGRRATPGQSAVAAEDSVAGRTVQCNGEVVD